MKGSAEIKRIVVPLERLTEAIRAEGLSEIMGTYGPVYQHVLFNMPQDNYRIAGGSCVVSETTATQRALLLLHQWLGADEKTIDTIGEILAKVAQNQRLDSPNRCATDS